MKRLLVLALVVVPAVALAQQPAPAPAPTPTPAAGTASGAWDVMANIGGADIAMKCTMTQKDADLSGSCASDQSTNALTGKLDGKKVTWQFDTVYEGQTLTVVYVGTLETAEKIVGTVDVRPMAVSGDFTATKAK
ncbi:MAG: hypothetical protein ABI634_01260 [Acidobacteriota bacterium]